MDKIPLQIPITVEVNATDLKRLEVLMRALGPKGKWELDGDEILAFAQVRHWVVDLRDRVKSAITGLNIVPTIVEAPEPEPEKPKRKKSNA